MSESENSETSELTELQSKCYKIHQLFHEIATDLKNAQQCMEKGRFFDAMDYITQSTIKGSIGEQTIIDAVQELKKDEKW